MPTESLHMIFIPTIFGCIMHFGLLATCQPKRWNYFSISIGSIAQHIAYFLTSVITGNPPVSFRPDTLSHTIHQNRIVSPCGTVAQHTMYISKFNMMTTTIKQWLPTVESIECILISKCMRGRTIRTRTETPHGISTHSIPISLERGKSCCGEHISCGECCQPFALRQRFITLQTEPSKITGLTQ